MVELLLPRLFAHHPVAYDQNTAQQIPNLRSKISISFQDEDSSCRIQSQSLINLVKFLLGQLLSLRPASTHSLSHCKTLPCAC